MSGSSSMPTKPSNTEKAKPSASDNCRMWGCCFKGQFSNSKSGWISSESMYVLRKKLNFCWSQSAKQCWNPFSGLHLRLVQTNSHSDFKSLLHCCYFLVHNCRNWPQDCCFVFFSPLFSCRQNQKPALAFIFDASLLQLTSTGVKADELVLNDLTMEKLEYRCVLILEFAFSLCPLYSDYR